MSGNILEQYSDAKATTSEYDKVTMPTEVLKDIVNELLSRAKKGDKTAFEVLKKVLKLEDA